MADVGWQKRGQFTVKARTGLESYCCFLFDRILGFPSTDNKMFICCAAFDCENRWKVKKDLAPGGKNLAFSGKT